jgi:hypothetical protein
MNNINKIEHLKQLHELRRTRTSNKVEKAIELLIENKEKINFNNISRASGVSKATLYKNKKIRELIEKLRTQDQKILSPKQIKHENEEKYKVVIITSLKRKVKILEEENKDLREQLKKVGKCLEKYRNSAS